MIFNHPTSLKKEGAFVFCGDVSAIGHPCLNKSIIKEFWHNFCFQNSSLKVTECDELIFRIGRAEALSLDGNAYSLNIEKDGVCVKGESEQALLNGIMTLLDLFTAIDLDGETAISAECCELRESPAVKNRMVHYCIFPETEIWELQRFVRFCAALKYTHVVLEFWGMLKYDCMKELSWSHGFTKDEVRPIIKEANDLGLEIIPMFNHWGHASACRVAHGKHVVLDQNPALQTYFSEDGWCWDIKKPKVRALLRSIREELTELCGAGKYFHIGCDEAYNFEFTEENMAVLSDFINEISDEMAEQGRRIFVWGDMFLYRYDHYNPKNRYTCNAPSADVEKFFLNSLSKRVIIADWQYRADEYPVETCSVFTKAGFDCVLCPWDEGRARIDAVLDTVKAQSLMGYMHTTWHTLSLGMPYVVLMGVGGFEKAEEGRRVSGRPAPLAAAVLRKVMPVNGDYAKSGWGKFEISCRW